MVLDDFANDDTDQTPDSEHECPSCETVGEKSAYWYYRCDTDSCEVVTYTYPERRSGL